MLRSLFLALAAMAALTPALRGGEENWAQLKLGMTAEETLAKLGRPMLKSSGKGFEVWIYDNGSEAVMYGSLIGWTAPASAKLATRSTDIWSEDDSGEVHPTFLWLLPKRVAPVAPKPKVTPPSTGRGDEFWLPTFTLKRR